MGDEKRTTYASLLAGLGLAVWWAGAFAGGFAVPMQGTSGLGNANAGVAASAEDASTAWWNPAGMSLIAKTEIVTAVHLDDPTIRFHDDGSKPALGQTLGGTGGNAGHLALIPTLYGITPIMGDKLVAGLAIAVPYGLKTQYDDGWMGRFQAVKSQIKTIDVSPALSTKAGNWTIGGGLDVQYFNAELTNQVNYTAVIASALPPALAPPLLNPSNPANILGLEGRLRLVGSDTSTGWNVGAIYDQDPLKVGLHYRSGIRYQVTGNVKFDAPTTSNPLAAQIIAAASQPGGPLANGDVFTNINLPATATLGATYRAASNVELLGGVTWTGWSSIHRIEFTRNDGRLLNAIDYNWQDTWRISAGANYWCNDQWKLRGGIAWDQTVIRDDASREPRLPDADRYWITVGARYQPASATHVDFLDRDVTTWFDFAFAYIQARTPRLDSQNGGSTARFGSLDGTYTSRSLIFSVQVSASF